MKIIIALLCILFASPALAVNELSGHPLAELQEAATKHGAIFEQLNDADAAAMDVAMPGRPMPSVIYLVKMGESAWLILERDGEIIFSSDPVLIHLVNKILGRTEA